MPTAYAPSLGKVIQTKGENHNNRKDSFRLMYPRKHRPSSNEANRINLSKWISDLCEWISESPEGFRTIEEIKDYLDKTGGKFSTFKNRVQGHDWLLFDKKTIRILSVEETEALIAKERIDLKCKEVFGCVPKPLGAWVEPETLKAGDWIWVNFVQNANPKYTTYCEVKENGVIPGGAKCNPILIDGLIFKRDKAPRAKK